MDMSQQIPKSGRNRLGFLKTSAYFLAALDLCCIMQTLLLCKDSPLVARELSSWQHAGLVAVWTLVP